MDNVLGALPSAFSAVTMEDNVGVGWPGVCSTVLVGNSLLAGKHGTVSVCFRTL
jgi:hypothetical protein